MKLKYFSLITLVLLVFTGSVIAAANEERPGGMVSNKETITATVVEVNKDTREVTLQGPGGKNVTIIAGKEVVNFDKIKKGDQVNAEYEQALALALRKSNEPLTHEETTALETAKKGEQPGMKATRVTQITAQVEKIDYDNRLVTLKGPKGNIKEIKVGDEVKKFNEIKKGDQVVANFYEALAINVTPKKK